MVYAVFIYSDIFVYWRYVFSNHNKIGCNVSKPNYVVARSLLNCQDFRNLSAGKDGLELTVTFHNFTGKTVNVLNRHGVRFPVRTSPTSKSGEFIIRQKYHIPKTSSVDIQRMLVHTNICESDYPELSAFYEGSSKVFNNNITHQNIPIIIDTVVHINEIIENDIYVTNADLVLTLKHADEPIRHPLSHQFLTEEKYRPLTDNQQGVGCFIDIVDNQSEISTRFMLHTDKILRIKTRQDLTMESGIYRIIINEEGELVSDRFDFDKCGQLGLYRTKEDALASGDKATLLKAQMAAATQEHQMAIQELQRQREEANKQFEIDILAVKSANLRIEQDNKNKDKEIQELQLTRDRDKASFEISQSILKSEYDAAKLRDQREADRKSNKIKILTEALKFSVAILTTAVAVLAIVKKTSNKT